MANESIELGIRNFELAVALLQAFSYPHGIAATQHSYVIPKLLIMKFHFNTFKVLIKQGITQYLLHHPAHKVLSAFFTTYLFEKILGSGFIIGAGGTLDVILIIVNDVLRFFH